MSVQIVLTDDQLEAVKTEAGRRQSVNEARGLKGRNRAPHKGADALRLHYLGCMGEMAVASYLELTDYVFQATDAVRGSTDLPGGLEVKTRAKHNYDLLVQLDDDPSKIFVLVTCENETVQIVGWIRGHEAMRKEYGREFVRGRPCYAIPQKCLNSIETLTTVGITGELAPKVIGSSEFWVTEATNGDLMLNFSEDIANQLGWKPGDMLHWMRQEDSNEWVIAKVK